MKITISGDPGAGKSTISKMLVDKFNLKYYSSGQLQRDLAKERGISLIELAKLEEQDPELDKYVDEQQREIGKQDNVIIDSRIGFHFVPDAVKLFLKLNDETAAKRIFEQKRNNEENPTYEITLSRLRRRKQSELDRFKKYYDVDLSDESNYDLVIDTCDKTPDEIVGIILDFIENRNS